MQEPRFPRYVHHFARRDGVGFGGGHRAELVTPLAVDAVPAQRRQQMLRIDALFREWTRHRTDVDKLRRLRDAISECLDKSLVEQHCASPSSGSIGRTFRGATLVATPAVR